MEEDGMAEDDKGVMEEGEEEGESVIFLDLKSEYPKSGALQREFWSLETKIVSFDSLTNGNLPDLSRGNSSLRRPK